ncbi:GNAT family N-acetyltransferase [Cerasicoccus fimbriatus]|uniref:GNAT family N-acetyltransferase n=1 Tax=Cerasicoccus fimbriatus TaxID=3014554 RepID=UPI0022B2D2F7|nr:GNAT family N-acetyltransferase [Cerasicoccus sp. TK19100]
MPITYQRDAQFDLDQFIELYRVSTLGERRPVENRDVMQAMMEHGNLTITAWDAEKLVGIARTLTDFAYVAYLADLAVHADYQKRGIGAKLVEETRAALEPTCFITLLSAPAANDFYPKIGFEQHPRAWVMNPK